MDWPHQPVMLAEVLQGLSPKPDGVIVDGTLGAAGHAAGLLEASSPDGRLLGMDKDPQALDLARERLSPYKGRFRLVRAAFDKAGDELRQWGVDAADGILLDLGVSSMQLDQAARGFSFMHDGPLDMRMGGRGQDARELVNGLSEAELRRIFSDLGEEPLAGLIARAVVKARRKAPLTTTSQLASLVEQALPARERRLRKLHPATRVFMGLRLAVNDELGHLSRFLDGVASWLRPGGRVAVISYHSLEDRLVKKAFARMADPCTCPPDIPVCGCGKRPLVELAFRGAKKPAPDEVEANPRARSARLRVAVRTGEQP